MQGTFGNRSLVNQHCDPRGAHHYAPIPRGAGRFAGIVHAETTLRRVVDNFLWTTQRVIHTTPLRRDATGSVIPQLTRSRQRGEIRRNRSGIPRRVRRLSREANELTTQAIGHKKSPARSIRVRDRRQPKTAADYRRSAITWAASATGTATELPPSRSRTSMVPLLTVSRPATAISGTPISSASLNLTPGDTFLRSS